MRSMRLHGKVRRRIGRLMLARERQAQTELQREDGLKEGGMVNGAMVLLVAFGALAAVWVIILYWSRFFGPKTD
jgi:Flp pilus assembly protein TadB